MSNVALWLATCHRRQEQNAKHWILILAEENGTYGTWYHSTGGPTQNKSYKVEIQTKRVQSQGIESHHFIGCIPCKDNKKVKASVQKVRARYCQAWAVDVLRDLERKGLVDMGVAAQWDSVVEKDPYAVDENKRSM